MFTFLVTLLGFCIFLTLISLYFGYFWVSLLFFIFSLYFIKGFKKIPSDPPTVGLVTFWGERTGETKEEGITLLAPYFPFFYDVQLIKVVKINEDIPFTNVRCVVSEDKNQNRSANNNETGNGNTNNNEVKKGIRSGGSVTVVVSITWVPDEKNLISYTTSGEEKGVRSILSDKMADVIRQMGRTHTWEEMTFATDVMNANLILEITRLDEDDNVVSPNWKTTSNKLKEDIKEDDLATATKLLKKALNNGVADSHDLGIKIRRLNIKQVEPEGELKKDAEDTAREVQQRRAENYELETEIDQAQILYEKYQTIKSTKDKTFEDCILEIRRRKLIKDGKGQIYDISGIPPQLSSLFKKGE